ncbi:FKBP-type peptidyl-prolyl cis-trans isomerase FklB [Sinobacterium caligoides]|uniref:Peptidyl-prolyl cis-trans isomerase n=1 Tax=Sinobacterium caligoides TaxID=933926 RepID=A0A3N2DNV9_9GAMM|nr:FKBP-type peptidyl-prolyl cis-trans isomerase [Sinobacterium caligoides]ROS01005.1 FKBP-type peptidyl-prolyl cis-trans isomerase FklB [Sinobacterium caligoides]
MATENKLTLSTDEQKVSYGLGRQFGDHLVKTQIKGLDLEAVIVGMEQAFHAEASVLSSEDLNAAFEAIQAKLQVIANEKADRAASEGGEFLLKNAKRNGVKVLDSGLQYEIIVKGKGAQPALTSTVRTHYHGTLIDGTVFDSSVERNQPAEFPVDGVIAGWTEALQMMPVGSKWRLYIPSNLAYGERGAGASIPPGAALIFDVELLDIL